jgi:hypothetical protein
MRWLLVTLALFVLQAIGAGLFGVAPPELPPGSAGAGAPAVVLVCAIVSNGLIASVLVLIARRATPRGAPLAAGLFAVTFGIGHLAAMIEAYAFSILPGETILRILGMMAFVSLGAALLAARLTGGPPPDAPTPRSWWPALHRLALVGALYLAAYLTAGMLAYPYVEWFYATRGLPALPVVASLQCFVRGPLFGAILAWLVGSTTGSRASRAWLAGATMSILAGMAPLVLPNPYLPDAVRWAHFVEVCSSNFVFGALAGWLLTRARESPERGARSVESEARSWERGAQSP